MLLYVSDYTLTLACARMYQAGVKEKLVIEGSYEITPFYQRDIDTLRRVSPRFLGMLVYAGVWLAVVWYVAMRSVPEIYQFVLGALIGIQLAIHIRHLGNFVRFRAMLKTDLIRGRLEYSRAIMLRQSSLELLAFAGLYLALFLFTDSWFILGGSVACVILTLKHWRLMRKQKSKPPAA